MALFPKLPKKFLDVGAIVGAVSLGIGLYLGYTTAKGALRSIDQYGGWVPDQFINQAPYDYSSNITYYFPEEDFRIMLA